MKLIDVALSEADKAHRTAVRMYGVLLGQHNEPAGDDGGKAVKKLKGLIDELGKTPAEVEADRRVVERAASLCRKVDAGRGAARRATQAREAVAEHDAQTARIIDERRARYRKLYAEQREVESAKADAGWAAGELEQLVMGHSDLLAGFRSAPNAAD